MSDTVDTSKTRKGAVTVSHPSFPQFEGSLDYGSLHLEFKGGSAKADSVNDTEAAWLGASGYLVDGYELAPQPGSASTPPGAIPA